MQIDKITAKVRPRKSWEAIDLGVALVQQHAAALYSIWILVTLPAFIILCLIEIYFGWYAILIFWWLKPLWERPLLHYLSRHLFAERLSVLDCVKAFFTLAKKQTFTSLTWRRLSPTRSLDLPILQLENLSGSERSKRLQTIHSIGSSSAIWVTVFFSHLEVIIFAACLALFYLLIPSIYVEQLDLLKYFNSETDSIVITLLFNGLTYLGMTLVAPFYIACGFSLYLNHRTLLEAWDIELTFKKLMKRLSTNSLASTIRLLSFLMFIGFSVIQPPLKAAETQQIETKLQNSTVTEISEQVEVSNENKLASEESFPQISRESASAAIKNIKNGESFKQTKMVNYLEYLGEKDTQQDDESLSDYSGFELVGKILSMLIRFGLWVVVALVVIFLIVRYRHVISGVTPSHPQRNKKPSHLFGLDVTQASLPDQPWLVAEKLIQTGEMRAAISLLYRATLVWLIENKSVEIKSSFTELECLRSVAQLNQKNNSQVNEKERIEHSQFKLLSELTYIWREIAYAHKQRSKDELRSLCQAWPRLFESQATTVLSDLNSSKRGSQ